MDPLTEFSGSTSVRKGASVTAAHCRGSAEEPGRGFAPPRRLVRFSTGAPPYSIPAGGPVARVAVPLRSPATQTHRHRSHAASTILGAMAGPDASDEVVEASHRVHIDTLEYTRDGLRTREDISLRGGARNRVILVRPTRVPMKTLPGLPYDRAFPGAAIAGLLADRELVGRLAQLPESARIQVFGHANLEDNLDHNKALSEQRAQALVAILIGDGEALESVSKDDAGAWASGRRCCG